MWIVLVAFVRELNLVFRNTFHISLLERACTHTHAHTHSQLLSTLTHTHSQLLSTLTHTHILSHALTHSFTHTLTHTFSHSHMHTLTQRRMVPLASLHAQLSKSLIHSVYYRSSCVWVSYSSFLLPPFLPLTTPWVCGYYLKIFQCLSFYITSSLFVTLLQF
jgi:hypothetical protein